MISVRVAIAVGLAILALAGCRTEYRPYDARPVTGDAASADAMAGREVRYQVARAFYRAPPECVVVLPAPKGATRDTVAARRVERAVARHLRDRIPRVIGPLGRDRAARRLALDMSHPGDRRRFAELENCDAFVRWRTIGVSSDNLLVWSSRGFGLEVEMFREPDRRLWRASHVAHRSDGGLPLTPISASIAIFEASWFSADSDIVPSMIDDTMRRLVVSLPDIR